MIKTFRGRLADGDQRKIRLSTPQGLVGYKITQIDLIDDIPGTQTVELVLKVFKQEQNAVNAGVNLEDPNLLAVGYYTSYNSGGANTQLIVLDEGVPVNQDIYVTAKDAAGSARTNYMIKLEQVTLSQHEAAVATLKDLRGRE
tara:strand:- start:629 stop:1057 length:429 start_codon:yes stop_codon:yes gene_type:complete